MDDFKLSVSKTKCFDHCKKQYQFNYILKFPKKDRDYLTSGSFCHKVLEVFHQAYINQSQLPYHIEMQTAWKMAWEEFKNKMTPAMKKDCWDMMNGYLKRVSENKKNGKLFNFLATERSFEIKIADNIFLRGAIDVTAMDDDNVLKIADYKTTKDKKYLINDFFQLKTYAFVVMYENPNITKVRTAYIMLRHNGEEIMPPSDFTAEEVMPLKEKFIEYANKMINEQEFPASPSNLCNFCDFIASCESGRKMAYNNPAVIGEVSY